MEDTGYLKAPSTKVQPRRYVPPAAYKPLSEIFVKIEDTGDQKIPSAQTLHDRSMMSALSKATIGTLA
jgi:hypothetical protein